MARHRSATLGLYIAAVALACPARALAAPSVSIAVDANNTIPNVVANAIFADGDGIDVTAFSLSVELGQGTIYNATTPDNALPQTFAWAIPGFEHLEFDSWLGIPGNGTNGIAGGAGDLGAEALPMVGLTGQGHQTVSATWFNTDKTNTGLNRVGNISLSDDAQGTWSLGVTFAHLPNMIYLQNPVIDGELVFDPMPGDLGADGFVGIADLSAVLSQWNQSVPVGEGADALSADGYVGINDLNVVLSNWNHGLVPLVPGSRPGEAYRDLDSDGFVGLSDLNIVLSYWNQNVTLGDPLQGDPSGDGFVGIDDKVWCCWNEGTPPAPVPGAPPMTDATVPEPGTFCLLIVCLAASIRTRAA